MAAIAAALPATAADKVLRIAVQGWTPGLGNPYASIITGAIHPYLSMFDALTTLGADGAVTPRLALSWRAETPTRWVFVLRPNVAFANGEPFDAGAVVAMIDWLKSPDGQRFFLASEARNIVRATAIDPLTVAIDTTAPDAILPKRMSLLQVVPPKHFAQVGADAFAQAAFGTGPFVLKTWGRDTGRSVWTANPTSWRGAPALDAYEFVVLPEPARRAQALALGEVDVAYNIGLLDGEDLRALGQNVLIKSVATVGGLALPNNRPNAPLADVRVRQAMNYAVDRATIAKMIMNDAVAPSVNGIEPGVVGHDPALAAYPYDPAKAKALLAEAGFADGVDLVAAVISEATTDGAAVYQRIAQDLAAVGIRMELRNVLGTDWVRMWFSGDWRGADILSHTWGGSTYMDALRPLENIMCAKSGAYFCVPELDARITASTAIFDPAEREAALHAILAEVHRLAPAVWLFPQTDVMAFAPRVKAIEFEGRFLDWTKVDIAGDADEEPTR
ncbi:MAG: ABC transporter substrate-binding protein [Rhodospirillaceae bacterium]|nr:ABC transporter substrate-binding protein [Rhodospirillaceae bacterium]